MEEPPTSGAAPLQALLARTTLRQLMDARGARAPTAAPAPPQQQQPQQSQSQQPQPPQLLAFADTATIGAALRALRDAGVRSAPIVACGGAGGVAAAADGVVAPGSFPLGAVVGWVETADVVHELLACARGRGRAVCEVFVCLCLSARVRGA